MKLGIFRVRSATSSSPLLWRAMATTDLLQDLGSELALRREDLLRFDRYYEDGFVDALDVPTGTWGDHEPPDEGPAPAGPTGIVPDATNAATTIVAMPIVAALARQALEEMHDEYREQFILFGLTRGQQLFTLVWEARYNLLTAVLAGFGRAIAEVGAVLIVGGNIDHLTRVMTTTIALETSRGNLAIALGLGFVLILISLGVNALLYAVRATAGKARYA